MPYAHDYGPPYVAITPDGTATPRQECDRCGTIRNPITRGIIAYGRGFGCHVERTPVPTPEHDTTMVRDELEKIRASGRPVDVYYAPQAKARVV